MLRTKHRQPSLARRFLWACIPTMIAVWAAVVGINVWNVTQQFLGAAETVAQGTSITAVHGLTPGMFNGDAIPDTEIARLHEIVAARPHITAVRLWSLSGELVFDSTGATSGFANGERLDEVRINNTPKAQLTTQVISDGQGSHRSTATDVYTPAIIGDEVVGAVEIVIDATDSIDAITETVLVDSAVLAAGFIVIFLAVRKPLFKTSTVLRENASQAFADQLTDLPNRRALVEGLDQIVKERVESASETKLGLMMLDVDAFKEINDSLGHDAGDELLIQVARRLRAALREGDVVARLGGDEFAVLLPGLPTIEAAEKTAWRLHAMFDKPFNLAGMPIKATTSIGVSVLPDHGTTAPELMRLADVAMYTAKTHRDGVAVYSPDSDDSSPSRLVLVSDLHEAVKRDELVMHYQPKIDLFTGNCVGYEALVRWEHPTRGQIQPNIFIPLAEQTGVIRDLTVVAITKAVQQIAAWRAAGLPDQQVAVNLSAIDVEDPELPSRIIELLNRYGVSPHLLEVEVTETAVSRTARVMPVLRALRDLGVTIAIDDFGIGQTNIKQLPSWPVNAIKIDREFIRDLTNDPSSPAFKLVKGMIEMARAYDMDVVAEGVETESAAAALRALGVPVGQGYLWSRPLPADQLPLTTPAVPAGA